jgi:hypothetical protein
LFPTDIFIDEPFPGAVQKVIGLRPWKDYEGRTRIALVEINGAEAPLPTFTGERHDNDREYVPPEQPSGSPWDRVLDWTVGTVVLGSGDYAVWGIQFRVGDGGGNFDSYPVLMELTASLLLPCVLCEESSKDNTKGWTAKVASQLALVARPGGPLEPFPVLVVWDSDYIKEYYRPYFEEGPDAFDAQRFGSRAQIANEMMSKMVPGMVELILGSMTPENRAEALRRFAGSGIDINQVLAHNRG